MSLSPKPSDISTKPRSHSAPPRDAAVGASPSKWTDTAAIQVFGSADEAAIAAFCDDCVARASASQLVELVENAAVIETVISSITSLLTCDVFASICQFLSALVAVGPCKVIDAGVLFAVDPFLDTWTAEALSFYLTLPALSSYARDAMVCMGVLDRICEVAVTAKKVAIQVACARVVNAAFACGEPVARESINFEAITKLLSLTDTTVLQLVIATLAKTVTDHRAQTEELFTLGVDKFIAANVAEPTLRAPCLCLAGSMASCQPREIQSLISSGVMHAVMEAALSDDAMAFRAFWGLTNFVEHDPDCMAVVLDENHFPKSAVALLATATGKLKAEVLRFLATVILFCPMQSIRGLVTTQVITSMAQSFSCACQDIAARCLDAIARVMTLALTCEAMAFMCDVVMGAGIEAAIMAVVVNGATPAFADKASSLMLAIRQGVPETVDNEGDESSREACHADMYDSG